MKRFTFILFLNALLCPLAAQSSQKEAKEVLDNATAAFHKSGGIKAEFNAKLFDEKQLLGQTQGTICLQEEKFLLKTPEAVTWFDGKTQWNYMSENEEVNIIVPTAEELQSLNPYAWLTTDRKGFECKTGTVKTFEGKSVHEIILTAEEANRDVLHIRLYITKDSRQPVYVETVQRDGYRSEITVTDYRTGQKYDDAIFTFDKKQYPNAEMIDLR